MAELRVLQFNADRGRKATTMLEKEFLENYDIVLVQEPYQKFQQQTQTWTCRQGRGMDEERQSL